MKKENHLICYKNLLLKRFNDFLFKFSSKREAIKSNYFDVLDGWRGISILLVLSAHLLPLGPKPLQLNFTAGVMGMSLFFTLSGFLIANFLIHRPNVYDFIIRRFFRILPLAWLYLVIAFLILNIDYERFISHILFVANYPPMTLVHGTSHFWSLCVEIQFYVGIATLFLIFRTKALYIAAFLCFFFTWYRINDGVYVAINTYYRIDEILVGVIIALAYNDKLGKVLPKIFRSINPSYVLVLFLISCHPDGGPVNYFRPYLAATLVASTIYAKENVLTELLSLKILTYLASISFALYVIHPLLVNTWFGSGDTFERYAKRPILFVVLFVLAHYSTFHYEKYWINFAKKVTNKKRKKIIY
ncbi:acyltransferase family protein [Methylophaga pinxianii]|uniref:acyltransferase family protein n=1 Tax=Methylophaga pinxianii TaxID=2881052 RepID=UPI001CF16960|nr:acyltransferase [Methylophaga pinxianii]MCB2426637.1 acyltransferase [Methylophaga pinxianii]UPH45103.1 acyltransferase [Methylophaga pinxianii]